jgi:hypothetical protein
MQRQQLLGDVNTTIGIDPDRHLQAELPNEAAAGRHSGQGSGAGLAAGAELDLGGDSVVREIGEAENIRSAVSAEFFVQHCWRLTSLMALLRARMAPSSLGRVAPDLAPLYHFHHDASGRTDRGPPDRRAAVALQSAMCRRSPLPTSSQKLAPAGSPRRDGT